MLDGSIRVWIVPLKKEWGKYKAVADLPPEYLWMGHVEEIRLCETNKAKKVSPYDDVYLVSPLLFLIDRIFGFIFDGSNHGGTSKRLSQRLREKPCTEASLNSVSIVFSNIGMLMHRMTQNIGCHERILSDRNDFVHQDSITGAPHA